MQELIKRLAVLIEGIGTMENVRPGCDEASMLTSKDWGRIRGMHDLLLAMEERLETIEHHIRVRVPGGAPHLRTLMEKA